MSVCTVLLFTPHMNWSFTWMDCKPAWHEEHEYSQSWATDFGCAIKFCMDYPSDWDKVAKLRWCSAGLEHLVTMVQCFESYFVHWQWRSLHWYQGYCFELNLHSFSRVSIFIFHDTISPTYPGNHDTKISFCFLNWVTTINLILALRLKTISMWCISCFYQNSNAVAVLA